ncbi:EAL domain-containing protein [Alkalicoccus daliensis]|uniref:EAL domain, c-di-GMP-specific phosphodiesterase class I (Or its enzymatically inactive variant) n=1 Tax=Alkalicoccus daliensis TaxID=745820 RepID=A0A1H0CT95_9BACI|nr:EAL domain-containing protein [Alkalicoccus daliensis]SDN61127.1 EAL domain, c-di-GMP-specific phosphodiesterase class I (or its enzymatically inactive variant) [Alkalicoccus daliensis]
MEACQLCQGKIPLNESGRMMLFSSVPGVIRTLHRAFRRVQTEFTEENRLFVNYTAWMELQQHMEQIEKVLPEEEQESLRGSLISAEGNTYLPGNEFPIQQLREQIANPMFVKVIQEKLFQSYMQPVIDTKTGKPFGYEFLLRPNSKLYPFNPGELFAFSQRSGLQSMLDSQARINAIRTGAHMLERGTKRFINFLPSSIYDPRHCLQSTFKAVREYKVDPDDLVFEVVETEKIEDISHLQFIFDEYKKAGIRVALDDLGSGYSTVEVMEALQPDYAKIDRKLVQDCHLRPEKIEQIKQLKESAGKIGTLLLAEGIEKPEEYEAVKPIVDYVQGYFFGKPLIKPAKDQK